MMFIDQISYYIYTHPKVNNMKIISPNLELISSPV